MRKLSRQERTYLIGIVVLLLLLGVKSLNWDTYQPEGDLEREVFTAYVQQLVSEGQSPFRIKRIVDIRPLAESETIEEDLRYDYRIKVRYYLFGFIPYWEKSDFVYE